MPPRRFPPPWSVEDIGGSFVVTDSAGKKADRNPLSCDPGATLAIPIRKFAPNFSQPYLRLKNYCARKIPRPCLGIHFCGGDRGRLACQWYIRHEKPSDHSASNDNQN